MTSSHIVTLKERTFAYMVRFSRFVVLLLTDCPAFLTTPKLARTGTRDGNWSVDLPVEEVPSELPEPCLGINYARDGMQRRDWLSLVAVHSDSWLMAVAFFYAVKLDAAGRCDDRKISQL